MSVTMTLGEVTAAAGDAYGAHQQGLSSPANQVAFGNAVATGMAIAAASSKSPAFLQGLGAGVAPTTGAIAVGLNLAALQNAGTSAQKLSAALGIIGGVASMIAPFMPPSPQRAALVLIATAATAAQLALANNENTVNDFINQIINASNTASNGPGNAIKGIKKKFSDAQKIVSPIALDLNGDGITTTGVQDGTYFDHDGNGFAEQTGWVNSQDGILVLDRNSNGTIDSGRELFGSETLLADGQKAANGYAALAELDTNQDGQINQQDAVFATLKIWKDANGYSSAGELFTLADAGIQSIATGYIDVNQTDANGNITQQASTFTKTDGSTGASADIWFQVDKANTIATDWLPETAAVAALPDLQGFGNVRDLHQAMLRDNTGHLQEICDAENDVILEMKRAG